MLAADTAKIKDMLRDRDFQGAWEAGLSALFVETEPHALASVHHSLCYAGNETGRPLAALRHGKLALELYEALCVQGETMVRIHNDIGGSCLRLSDYYAAVFWYETGVPRRDAATHPAEVAKLYMGLGTVYMRLNDPGRALEAHRTALRLIEGSKLSVYCHVYIVSALLALKRNVEARIAWKQLRDVSAAYDGYLLMQVFLYHARLLLLEGCVDLADDAIEAAMNLCEPGEFRRLALCHMVRAKVFLAMNRPADAFECAETAIHYAAAIPGNVDIADEASLFLQQFEGGATHAEVGSDDPD